MASGQITINFGAFPGKAEAQVNVTGQGAIAADSEIEAWCEPAVTADHSEDEHSIEEFAVSVISLVVGTGFTIVARPRVGICYGVYNFGWAWN